MRGMLETRELRRTLIAVAVSVVVATTPGFARADDAHLLAVENDTSVVASEASDSGAGNTRADSEKSLSKQDESLDAIGIAVNSAEDSATSALDGAEVVQNDTAPSDQVEQSADSHDTNESDGNELKSQEEITAQSEAAPLPSNAVSIAERTYIIESNVSDEKVLDAAGKTPSNGANVASWTYNGGNNQQWDIRFDPESGWYRIYLHGSNATYALAVVPTAQNEHNVGIAVAQEAGDEALWAFVKNGTWYNLINRATGLMLEVADGSKENRANIQVGAVNTALRASQRFFLIDTDPEVSGSTVTEAAYTVSPAANTSVAAEVRGASDSNGANVWLYTANGKDHQKIYLEANGSGTYIAWIVGTGKVLAQESSSLIPGTNVVQRTYTGDAAQLWAIDKYTVSGKTQYALVNKASGLALCAKKSSSGSNLSVTRNDGYATTLFALTRKPLLNAGIVEVHPKTDAKVSLDVQKAASSGNANLLLWTDTNELNQRFEFVSGGGTDLWRIRTASSGGWVTDTGSAVEQRGNGATTASDANTWRVSFKGGGYTLINKGSGKAIDMRYGHTTKGTQIIRYTPNGKDSQHFVFESATLLPTGCYFLQNGLGTCLDISNASSEAGANAQAWEKSGALGEYFTLELSGMAYRIKNTYSGKYITASGSANGANVTQEASSSSNNQRWKAVIADGGRVSFVCVASNKALDVKRNSSANGANVQIYTLNQGSGQVWKPIKTTYKPFSGYVLRAVNAANASSSATGYLIVVDKSNHKVIVMTGGNGTWKPYRTMACTVGAPATPTVEGSFVVSDRGTSFGEGYTCWYWTRFYGGYLFHSVVYNPGSKTSMQDGRLGMNLSHGCVRMDINDAYWIYSTIPAGTRVLVYS